MFNTREWSDEAWFTMWLVIVIGMLGSVFTTITVINNLGFRRAEFLKYQYCHATQKCAIELDGSNIDIEVTEY